GRGGEVRGGGGRGVGGHGAAVAWARLRGGGPWRRGGGRPCRVRGVHLHARGAGGAGAHHAAVHGGLVCGRQDGREPACGQEPGGNVQAARLRVRRHLDAFHAGCARVGLRLRRGGEVGRHRLRRLLLL